MKKYTRDEKAVLLLCAPLDLNPSSELIGQPLSPEEYNRLADFLLSVKARPGTLLSTESSTLIAHEEFPLDRERVKQLLARGFLLAQAIEKWQGRGCYALVRLSKQYPLILKRLLFRDAPVVLFVCGDITLLEKPRVGLWTSFELHKGLEKHSLNVLKNVIQTPQCQFILGESALDSKLELELLKAEGSFLKVSSHSVSELLKVDSIFQAISQGRCVVVSTVDPLSARSIQASSEISKLALALSDIPVLLELPPKDRLLNALVDRWMDDTRDYPLLISPLRKLTKRMTGLLSLGGVFWPDMASGAGLNLELLKRCPRKRPKKQLSLW